MPSGMGGLTRYFEEYQSRIQIKPGYVVLFVALLIAFEIGIRAVF
ncbi:preprotein translocase subunit Sec61beta [Nanoarchaeota archaeon]